MSFAGRNAAVRQRTLKNAINCTGIALHAGTKVTMTLRPGEPDSGIVFRRTDIAGGAAIIPATWDHVVDTRMCTMLGNSHGVTVCTVEHVMAALAGCRIDNAVIEVDGPEVPIMDGSAAPFVFLVECAGVVEQDAPRLYIRVLKPVSIVDDGHAVSLTPTVGKGLSASFEIDFDSPLVARQSISIGLTEGVFKDALARARTFGFLTDVERMRAAGLARGGSLDNAVVIGGDRILNEEGLRFADEFVRHKILDVVGDLYLAGGPIIGHFDGVCSGHSANNRLLRALFDDGEAWTTERLRIAKKDEGLAAGVWSGDLAAGAATA